MLPEQERELLDQLSSGNEAAFARLVALYAPRLFTYIFRLTRNREVSEEIVQDIFVQLWQTRETLTEVKNLGAWLFVLSRNSGANALKKIIRERLRHTKYVNEENKTIDEEVGFKEYEDLVDQAVGSLPPQQHKVWIMSRHQRLKYADIATQLHISEDMVKQHIKAANANILKYLQKHGDALLLIFFLVSF